MTNKDRALEYRSLSDGFLEDFKFVLDLFSKTELKFANFVEIWNDTQFNLIYSGRVTAPELLEFTEEAMCVAVDFMLNDKKDRAAEACGLYMTYSLYCTQNSGRKPYVRIPPAKAISLKKLKERAESERSLDFLYVLCFLLRDGAFRLVATEREYGLEKSIRKYIEGPSYRDTKLLAELTSSNALRELVTESLDPITDVLKDYQKAKCKLPGASQGIPCRELNYLKLDFINEIKSSLDETIGQTPHLGKKEGILKKYQQTPGSPPPKRKRKRRTIGRPKKKCLISNSPPKKKDKNKSASNATLSNHMELYCSAESDSPGPSLDDQRLDEDGDVGLMNMPIIIMEEGDDIMEYKEATITEIHNEPGVSDEEILYDDNGEKI